MELKRCLDGNQYSGLLRLPNRLPPGLHFFSLYRWLRWMWPPTEWDLPCSVAYFRNISLPYAGGSFASASQVLHRFLGLRCR